MSRRAATPRTSVPEAPAVRRWPSSQVRALGRPLRERSVRLLWGSQLVSEFGDWAARIAVTALVYERSRSSVLAAAAFVAGLLPWLGPGQVLATLPDRYGRRELMIVADVVRAALFLVIAVVSLPVWGVLVAVTLAGLATSPFESARSAGLVEYTSPERLSGAIRLSAVTYDAGTLLGYAGGALLLGAATPAWACAVNAGTFVVSAVLVAALPRGNRSASSGAASSGAASSGAASSGASSSGASSSGGAVRAAAGGVLGELVRTGAAMWGDPQVRAGALLGVLPVATGTALGSQVVPWAARAYPGADWVPGAVLAVSTGVCLLLTLAVSERPEPDATLRLAARLTAGACAAVAVLCLAGRPAAVAAALVVAGALFVPIVLAQTVVAPRLPSDRRATSFGLLMGLLTLAQAALSPVVGALTSAVGAPKAFAVTGLLGALAAVALLGARGVRATGPAPGRGEAR